MTKKFLSGQQIDRLHTVRRNAQHLEETVGTLPCWIFEDGQATKTLQLIKELQTILESLKEVSK